MNWTPILIIALAVILLLTISKAGTLPEAKAVEYLKQGAVVIDVRTTSEFAAGHLTNTINIPLDELKTRLPREITDRNQVILLHCRSGRRSGVAEKELRGLGYTNSFNIGSYEQAKKILGTGKK